MSKKFEMFSPNVASEEFVQKSIFLEYLESDERRMCVIKLVSTCLKGVFTSNQSCAWFALGGISYSKHCHSAWYSLLELSSSCKEASLLALLSFPNNFLFYSFLFFFPCLIWHCLAEGLADIFCGQCGLCQFLCHVWQSEFLWKFLWQIILLACHKKSVTCNSNYWTGLALLEILATSLLVNSMLTAMLSNESILYSTVTETQSQCHILAVNSIVGWGKSAFLMSVYFFLRGVGDLIVSKRGKYVIYAAFHGTVVKETAFFCAHHGTVGL